MSIPNKRTSNLRPTHPGGLLREDFLPENGLTEEHEIIGAACRVCLP